MKALVGLLLLAASAAAYFPTDSPEPKEYEAKWQLPGLTLPAVAAESSHSYDVRHYRIDLDLPMTDGSMSARCAIRLKSNVSALDSVFLDFVNLACDSVRLDGRLLRFEQSAGRLDVFPDPPIPAGDSAAIEVFYRRTAGTGNRGFYWFLKGSGRNYNHTVAYTITQPNDSRYWFPGWDHPWDKAEAGCQVNVTVPDSFTVAAPGLLDSVTTREGRSTFWWTHQYPVSTYLINFGASRYIEWVQQAHIGTRACGPGGRPRSGRMEEGMNASTSGGLPARSAGDSIPIYNYFWPEDSAAALHAFRNVPDMVEFFSREDRFGRYPFCREKYGHVAVFPFLFGGMEHQTMSTVHRQWVLNASESGIAHELAHMWFGDYVTCRDWREIWLNEGSATYLDPIWFYHFYGPQSFHNRMLSYAQAYFQSDARYRRPLYDPGLNRIFDWGHTYCKAAWVNHMTRYLHRDTVFDRPGSWFAAERAYLDSFAYGTATTEGRRRIHEAALGEELGWFYDEWVYQAGFPNYTVNWLPNETTDGREVVIDIAQDNGAQAPEFFRTPVEMLVSFEGGDTLLRREITANPQRLVIGLPAEPTGLVFDPGGWLLHKARITSGVAEALAPEVGVVKPVLHAPAPSPARERVGLRFSLPNERSVMLTIHDVSGRRVRTFASGRMPAGHHRQDWDLRSDNGRRVAAGVYLVRLTVGSVTDTRKLVVE